MSKAWNDIVAAMPTVQALRHVRRQKRRERSAFALLLVIGFYGAIALATPHCGSLQTRLLASSHYRPPSLASWIVLQPAPKMYGFANRVWRGPVPLIDASTGAIQQRRFAAMSFWVNHYPARMARYDGERGRVFAESGRTVHVMLQSRYRGTESWSAIEVRQEQGPLEMRSVEVDR